MGCVPLCGIIIEADQVENLQCIIGTFNKSNDPYHV